MFWKEVDQHKNTLFILNICKSEILKAQRPANGTLYGQLQETPHYTIAYSGST